MPPKKTRPYRKKKRTIKRNKRSLPQSPAYAFKRQFERVVELNNPDTASGWYAAGDNSVVKTFGVALEFTNLFKLYKLNYLVVELFPSHKTVNHANALANNATYPISNTQLICSMWRKKNDLDEIYFWDITTDKNIPKKPADGRVSNGGKREGAGRKKKEVEKESDKINWGQKVTLEF